MRAKNFLAMESVNSLRISAPPWWPLREGRDGKCEGRNEKCEFLARESVSSSPIVRIFGNRKRKFIANFSATMVTSLPSLSVCLYLSLSLSLSPKVPHAQYRKRFRASYNTKGVGFEMELVKAGICHHLATWLISSQDSSQQSYLFLFLEIPREKKSIFVQKRLRKAPEATSKGAVKDRLWLARMTADRSESLHAWHRSKAGFAWILNLAPKPWKGHVVFEEWLPHVRKFTRHQVTSALGSSAGLAAPRERAPYILIDANQRQSNQMGPRSRHLNCRSAMRGRPTCI